MQLRAQGVKMVTSPACQVFAQHAQDLSTCSARPDGVMVTQYQTMMPTAKDWLMQNGGIAARLQPLPWRQITIHME